jgi:glycosyltransferase involved in cell wall biosynthesis
VFTHGQLSPWFKRNHPLKHLKKWLYWPWAEYRVLRDAGAVIFTCEEERRLARDSFWLYSARERVIKYGTAGPANVPDLQMAAFFEQFSGLRGKRIILFMGRLHQIKGCDLAIRAFADQCRSDPKWHLVFCGPDSCGLQPKLARLAGRLGVAHRITWAGMIGGDLKWGAIRCADVFFLPSHQESFGMVVAEALACGVPVLISNKVNIWREIEADGAGLVEDDTSSGSSALLHRWTELSDAEQATMRVRAKQCFESRFAIKAASASLLSVLSTVSGKSQNASA